jgi:autotransporter-associated beta strand protein
MAAGIRRRPIRRDRLGLLLEMLEDRLPPAQVLHWTGAGAGNTLTAGLLGDYFEINPASTRQLIMSDPAWLGNQTPEVEAPLTGLIDFPNISTGGFGGILGYGGVTCGLPCGYNEPMTNVEARWYGFITIATAGPVSFSTTSDDGSVIYIDGTMVVNNNQFQGATQRTGTVNLSPGVHSIDVEYYQGGGGASMVAQWDPAGGSTFVDIPNSVFSYAVPGATPNINWSDPNNWAEHVIPANGDTLVFDSTLAGFDYQYTAHNDMTGLSLNGIVLSAPVGPSFTLTGNGVTINNTNTSLTNGITNVAGARGDSIVALGFVNLGGDMGIANGSPLISTPTGTSRPIDPVPSLLISGTMDLAGHRLTEGPSTARTTDTGFTALTGVISSSTPNTDALTQDGTGMLALSGKNTFDGPVAVNAGILVDAGNQALGSLAGAGTAVGPGAALGVSGGDDALYAKGVALAAHAAIVTVDKTSPTVAFPITLTGNALIQSDIDSSITFNGSVDIGTFDLTLNINPTTPGANTFRFNGEVKGAAGSTITKIGNSRASFMHDDSNLVTNIIIFGGRLGDGALNALGTGGNPITVVPGASLVFRNNIDHTETQTVTIAGPGSNIGSGPIGAISSDDGTSTIEKSWTINVAPGSDETLGTNGGSLIFDPNITLPGTRLVLGGNSGTLTLNGTITGPAGSAIVKNGSGTVTITSNNAATFTGTTTVNAGLLKITSAGGLGSGTSPLLVKFGGGLGVTGADLGAIRPILSGNGPQGAGAIENLGGDSKIGGTITIIGPTTFGSDAGTLTINSDIVGGSSLLTFAGAGDIVVNGNLSGDAMARSVGLLESQRIGWDASPYDPFDHTIPPPGNSAYGTDTQLYPLMAETPGNDHSIVPTTLHVWATNNQWIYSGTINWPNTDHNGSGTLSFAENMVDNTLLRVDGKTYINDSSWNTPMGTGAITLPAGPHSIDMRFYNGSGAAGPSGQNNGGWSGWDRTHGFIYRIDAGPSDPLANSLAVSDYRIPVDPGDGSLFSVQSPNVLTKVGSGKLFLNGNNSYQAPTVIDGGSLVVGSSSALGITPSISVADGAALVLAAPNGINLPANLPIAVQGAGPTSNGAIESALGSNTIASTITEGGPTTIAADAGTLTLTASKLNIGTGVQTFAGAGDIVVKSDITSIAAGLTEGQNGVIGPGGEGDIGSMTSPPVSGPDPKLGLDIQLGTTMAETTESANVVPPVATSLHTWTSNDTWIYTGTIFFPNDPHTPGSGTMSFAKELQDATLLRIDGQTLIANSSWTAPVGTGPVTLAAGPHPFEARFGVVAGGGGPAGQNNAGWTGWTTSEGFVYRIDNGPNDPLANSMNVSDYKIPIDPGDGSLFQTVGPSGIIKDGSGSVTLAPVNTFVGPTTINGGLLKIATDASLGHIAPADNTAPITINDGTLEYKGDGMNPSLSTDAIFAINGADSGIQVDAGQTLTINKAIAGAGTLTKLGGGTLVLAASDSLLGGSTVAAGTLVVKSRLSFGTGPLTLSGGTAVLDPGATAQTPIPVSGFNQDVIWAASEPDPNAGTTTGMNSPGGQVFYQAGAPFSPPGSGLPASGQIVSAANPAVSFQLQPYTADNVALMTDNTTQDTLTLATPGEYQTLNVLSTAANGNSVYTMTLHFSDGGPDTLLTPGVSVPNWFIGGAGVAIGGVGALRRTITVNDPGYNGLPLNPNLYEQDFALSPTDQARPLASVTFQQTNGDRLGIFALSGINVSTSAACAKSVVVTADSTINVPAGPTAIGPLSLTGGTLTLTGTATALTAPGTTVSGTAGVSPAAGETLNLGPITSGAASAILRLGGAGTVSLGTIPIGLTLTGSGNIGTGGLSMAAGSIDNPSLSSTSGDEITSSGSISIDGAKLAVNYSGPAPANLQKFTIIHNTSGAPIIGTFAGLPEGADLGAGGVTFTISYMGGSGDDVVLTTHVSGPATHFAVTFTVASAPIGTPVPFNVTALDANNILAANYSGTVHFTSPTDAFAQLPPDSTLRGGTGTFYVTFSLGLQTVKVADTVAPAITGTSNPVLIIDIVETLTHFSVVAPSTVVPGVPFNYTVIAEDEINFPVPYAGTVHFSSTDATAILPHDSMLINGTGVFRATLNQAGAQTLTATDTTLPGLLGTSNIISVIGSPPPYNYFKIAAPTTAVTGTPYAITVTAIGQSGGVNTAYAGHVHFTSSDPHAVLPADATLTNGVGVFSVSLTTPGNQTITATDSLLANPILTGTSGLITTRGMTVASFTPTANGFTATVTKPFNPADLALYGSGQNTVPDVTLVGARSGPISGTLVIDPTDTTITFVATARSLTSFFGAPVLPDDTYTATLISGAGTSGFLDALGAGLDGADDGGHANYTTMFTVANSRKSILSIPDFARGPDGNHNIQIPNDTGHGIPVTLTNATSVTDVSFTLNYDPSLLTVTNGSNGATDTSTATFALVGAPTLIDTTHAMAVFQYTSTTAQSGNLVLGDIIASVPDSAAGEYKAKELLHFTAVTVNGATFTGLTADSLHVNAYFGDVTGNGSIDGLDVATANNVAQGADTGFAAYPLLDPAIVGDVADDISVDAGDVSALAAYAVHLPTPAIPAIPTGIRITPAGPDPTLSLVGPGGVNPQSVRPAGGVVPIPILLDQPRPAGSTGMTEAVLAIQYNPSVLSVSPADITLGSIPSRGTGWRLESTVDQLNGTIGIVLYSSTPIASPQAGSLVNLAFHVIPTPGQSRQLWLRWQSCLPRLVSSAIVNGQEFTTQVDDAQGQFVLSPAADPMEARAGTKSFAARIRRRGR